MSRHQDLLSALAARAEMAGVSGVEPAPTFDATVAVDAPDLTGESVTFVALEDRTLVVPGDVPDGALTPIVDALEEMVSPPYRAAAARSEGDLWTAVAESVRIVALPEIDADRVELTVVDGARTLTVGGEARTEALPPLDALADEHESVTVQAERVDGDLFAVDVFPL